MNERNCLVRDPFLSVLLESLKRLIDDQELDELVFQNEPNFPGATPSSPRSLPLSVFLSLRDRARCAYGTVAAEGILWRAGLLASGILRRRLGDEMGFRRENFDFLFPSQRGYTTLLALAAIYRSCTPFSSEVSTQEKTWLWRMRAQGCQPETVRSLSTAPFTAGLIRGLLAEINGGKFYAVRYAPAVPEGILGLEVAREPLDG